MRTTLLSTGVVVFAIAALVAAPRSAQAQQAVAQGGGAPAAAAAEDEDVPELVVKVYRVSDLVVPAPNYPYEGTFLPGLTRILPTATTAGGMGAGMGGGTGGMGGGMGGMGGGMGGMGGGMFRVADDRLARRPAGPTQVAGAGVAGPTSVGPRSGSSTRITISQLISAIENVVDPESWDENGGDGVIQAIGGTLAISQTAKGHAKVDQFLTALRSESGTPGMVSIDAQWLQLDADQLAKVLGAGDKKRANAGPAISREALAALPADVRRTTGRITCFSGQTVHLITGRMETKLQGAIPVIGSAAAGYQATLVTPHIGTLLQITASLLLDSDLALVDLHSSVTRWEGPADSVKLGGGDRSDQPDVQVDRVNVGAQQLATSLHVPLGQPVLVGGMSSASGGVGGGADAPHLYLVVQVSASGAADGSK